MTESATAQHIRTRDRILNATARLFQRQGYSGTGMKQIAAESAAPFGSIYHFFPGGKEQLGDEVIRLSGRMYALMLAPILYEAPDPVSGLRDFFAGAAKTLKDTDYVDACPIAIIALEVASTNERLRIATAEVFESWVAAAGAFFEGAGLEAGEARRLAIAILSLLEGAFVFCRAMRTTEALEVAGEAAVAQAEAAFSRAHRIQ